MCMIFQLSIKQPIKPKNWHETCGCKCRLDASVCNEKQRWNSDKFRCEYKELIDEGVMMDVNANVRNHVMLVNTWIIQIVNAEKS